jgi:hypothetical protein
VTARGPALPRSSTSYQTPLFLLHLARAELWEVGGVAPVAVPCEKAGEGESRRAGRCGPADVGLTQRIMPPFIYSNYFQKDLN